MATELLSARGAMCYTAAGYGNRCRFGWQEPEAGMQVTKGITLQIVKSRVTVACPLNERCHFWSYRTRIWVETTDRSHPVSLKAGLTSVSD